MRKFATVTVFLLFLTLLNNTLFSQSKKVTDLLDSHNLELPGEIQHIQNMSQPEWSLQNVSARAADGQFTTPVSGVGLDGLVEAVLADGDDIYLGGTFSYYDGEVQLNGIAKWNGESFESLGEGFNGGVSTLLIYNNELIAAGWFTKSGETELNGIARWTGENWVSLGDGFDNSVLDLLEFNGKLIAAGGFLKSGTTEVNNIASWDGTEWIPLGEGLNFDGGTSVVWSLAEYENQLIAGGEFSGAGVVAANSIASWNGTGWESLGDGFRRQDSDVNLVSSLTLFEEDLVMSGLFIDPESSALFKSDIMQWDGTEWSQVGISIPGKLVHALDVLEGQMVTAGSNLGGESGFTSYLTLFDGFTWNPDALPVVNKLESTEQVLAMEADGDRLIFGGEFRKIDDKLFNFAYLQNDELFPQLDTLTRPVPLGSILAIKSFNNELFVGGDFDYPDDQGMNILRYNGQGWDFVNSGFAGAVTDIIEFEGDLIAAAEYSFFNKHGSIARWDGAIWEPVGEGLVGDVMDLVVFDGNIVAAGQDLISHASDRFVVWDGQEWSPLYEDPQDNPGFPRSLEVINGNLFAGGSFSEGEFLNASHIAWWNGEVFEPVGDGFNSLVFDLADYNGELVASGNFTKSGDTDVPQVAHWDGETWNPFGEGFGLSVRVVENFQGDLIAGGNFIQSGETITPGVARWNGDEWLPIGSGVLGGVDALHADGSKLHIGGSFREADNEPALNYTIWNETITSVDDENRTVPVEFTLHQNFPNPFNPSTIISFDLPTQSDVRLEVFNTLGQRVALLQDDVLGAGTHNVSFDAGSLASGIYLYRLTADGYAKVKRLTLLK